MQCQVHRYYSEGPKNCTIVVILDLVDLDGCVPVLGCLGRVELPEYQCAGAPLSVKLIKQLHPITEFIKLMDP